MKQTILLLTSSLLSFHLAALEPMTDQDLQAVEGQAGADLSLKLSLNQKNTGTPENPIYTFDDGAGGICQQLAYCHLGLAVNKRYVQADASKPSGFAENSESGQKLWLVFKGIQGTVDIQKLGLDGIDLIYNDSGGKERIKPAIQFSFDVTKPILIRNFGFNALAIEKDNFTSQTNADGSITENSTGKSESDYGYLKATTYTTANAPNSAYDYGRETGFVGMQMNGNLALNGKMMMFSCDASHPRC